MANTQPATSYDLVLSELQRRVKDSGSQKAAAKELGISAQHLGDILRGRRTASASLLEKLGLVKVIIHIRVNDLPDVMRAITNRIKKDS